MIKVNLIPPERRRPEKTPMIRFLVIIAGCAISVTLIFLCLMLWFKTISDAKGKIVNKNKELNKIKQVTKNYDVKKKKWDNAQKYIKSLKALASSRNIYWYEKLDKLCSLIDREDYAWIDNIKCSLNLNPSSGRGNKAVLQYAMEFDTYTSKDLLSNEKRFKQAVIDTFIKSNEFNSWNGDAMNSNIVEFSDYKETKARFLPLKLEFYKTKKTKPKK